MTPTANLASAEADADHPAAAAAEAASFVLNLCSSTTPMALPQTDVPELKRFTFFVSRRFEEGRERFRLHMGFFASQTEAEEWLGLVREIYPGAWAGEAPGKKLRARAAAAAAAQAQHAVGPQKTAAPVIATAAPPARPVSAPTAPVTVSAAIPQRVPTLHPPAPAPARAATSAAPATQPAAVASTPAKAAAPSIARRGAGEAPAARAAAPPAPAQRMLPAARAAASPTTRAVSASAGAARAAAAAAPARSAVASAPAVRPSPVPAARSASAAQPRPAPAKRPIFADSNVKEVLAALGPSEDATADTRLMPAPIELGEPAEDSSLTDTQVLRFLETRRVADEAARASPASVDAAAAGISLLKPDDTGTRRALKEAVSHDQPVSFAVQLQWSVQPVALDKVPPLAIFSAYTLYSVEGSREGRKWYGLRLGFFSDAISAKQVAHYVRSEFTSVAVVPVSPQERDRATEDNQRFAGVGAARKRRKSEDTEFKLIDSDEAPRAALAAAATPQPASAPPPAVRAARKGPGKVGARERRTPQTLEETLEILGANELAIDNGSDASLSDTGVRHLRVEIQKNTPLSRLFERLSERVRKS